MESDGEDYRTMTEQQKHKGIKGDAQKRCKSDAKGDVFDVKGVPFVGAEMTPRTMQDTVQWMSDQVKTNSSMDRTL